MSTDRVFREEDAIWWDAHVRGPRRYTFREMDEEYKGISPFSNGDVAPTPDEPKHIYIIDPEAAHRIDVDVDWLKIIALSIATLGAVVAIAIFAAAAVVAVVTAGVVLGIIALAAKS